MIPQGPAHQDGIANPCPVCRYIYAFRHHANSSCGDKNAISLALLHYLGITGNYWHTRFGGCLGHALNDAFQFCQGKALLQNKSRRQVERPGTSHGDIINSAVYRQRANVTSREKQRCDHVTICTDDHATRFHIKRCIIIGLQQQFIVEIFHEQPLDQLCARTPTCAVTHLDQAIFQTG